MLVCLFARVQQAGAPQLQNIESDIAVVCSCIGVHLCQAIVVPLFRAFRYSGCRYRGPPIVHNDKCFVRNPYPVSILELITQNVNVLMK